MLIGNHHAYRLLPIVRLQFDSAYFKRTLWSFLGNKACLYSMVHTKMHCMYTWSDKLRLINVSGALSCRKALAKPVF